MLIIIFNSILTVWYIDSGSIHELVSNNKGEMVSLIFFNFSHLNMSFFKSEDNNNLLLLNAFDWSTRNSEFQNE